MRRRVGDPHAAEDVLQEVLLRVHLRAGELRDPGALDGWAHRVARNAIVDHVRGRPPEVPTDAPTELPAEDEPADEAFAALARCLPALVQRLPPPQREALELCDLGGLTQAEAAARLDLTVPGMKARVQRARAQLRAVILACCDVALDARNHVVEYVPAPDCRCATGP